MRTNPPFIRIRIWVVLATLSTALLVSMAGIAATPAEALENGTSAPDEAPWAVKLLSTFPDGTTDSCSGSLIRQRVVLTAGHCVVSAEEDSAEEITLTVGGVSYLATTSDVRTDFNAAGDYDIALIRIPATPFLKPTIPLPSSQAVYESFVGEGVTTFSFGRTSNVGNVTTVVQKSPDGSFRIAPFCQSSFRSDPGGRCLVKTAEYSEDPTYIWRGDSGGTVAGWHNGGWVQLGVITRSYCINHESESEGNCVLGEAEFESFSAGPFGFVEVTNPEISKWIDEMLEDLVPSSAPVNPAPANPVRPAQNHQLQVGEGLVQGQRLVDSSNRGFEARMQFDGNFVVYDCNNAPLWASDTDRTDMHSVRLQSNGRVVGLNTAGTVRWQTPSQSSTTDLRLVMQGDGNLVLYSGSSPLWASNTAWAAERCPVSAATASPSDAPGAPAPTLPTPQEAPEEESPEPSTSTPQIPDETPQFCNGVEVTVNLAAGQRPTNADDVILGTEGEDVINAGDGHDVICAQGGDDVINAGNGADTVFGGDGNDTINAGQGRDTVFAGAGNDFVSGGKGKDMLVGGAGNDELRGNEGTDVLNGGSGDDLLRGGQKADALSGGQGEDVLVGGTRPDLLDGGAGLDEYNGGGGIDSCLPDPANLLEQRVSCEL